MRLRSVEISNFKNLRDFSIDFAGDEFIDIFVGKNGSGKSNFLEALIEVFDHVYNYDGESEHLAFNYSITWEIANKKTTISWRQENQETDEPPQLSINGRARKTIGKTPLPDNLLVYYSGQNEHVSKIIRRYEKSFRRRIRGSNVPSLPNIVGIEPSLKELLVWLILLLPDDRPAREFVCQKLGILGNQREARITLKKPFFADRRNYDPFVDEDLFWGLKGVTRTFIDELLRCVRGGVTPGALYDREDDSYTIALDLDLFRRVFAGFSSAELFRQFCAFELLGMLGKLSMIVTVQGFDTPDLSQFSDGQFQSVYLYAVSELFKDRDCVTLLDEPDAFLHPEWQFEFLTQAKAISQEAACTNHILMSSHSAATLIPHKNAHVRYFETKNGVVKNNAIPKRIAIEKLSAKLIKYSEQEQLLSIINAIQIEKKPVLFTEGSIDPVIIKEAWQRVRDEPIPFIPFYAFSCTYLKQLLTDDRISNEMAGLPVFGLFDLDKAFDQWNGIQGETLQQNVVKGRVKKVRDRNAYALLLPVPVNAKIRSQVLPGIDENNCFGGNSLCEIEHLFYGDPATDGFFAEEPAPGGGTKVIIRSDAKKEQFAREIVPQLADHYFEVFSPLFDFIGEQINHAEHQAATQ